MLQIRHMLADSLMDDERIINLDVMHYLNRIEMSSYQYKKLYVILFSKKLYVILFSWVLVYVWCMDRNSRPICLVYGQELTPDG